MTKLYTVSNTIPLDVNGNSPHPPHLAPTPEEIIVTSALIHHFFGSRFTTSSIGEGFVSGVAVQKTHSKICAPGLELTDTINFNPITSYNVLLNFVFLERSSSESSNLAKSNLIVNDSMFNPLVGTGVFSGERYVFNFDLILRIVRMKV